MKLAFVLAGFVAGIFLSIGGNDLIGPLLGPLLGAAIGYLLASVSDQAKRLKRLERDVARGTPTRRVPPSVAAAGGPVPSATRPVVEPLVPPPPRYKSCGFH